MITSILLAIVIALQILIIYLLMAPTKIKVKFDRYYKLPQMFEVFRKTNEDTSTRNDELNKDLDKPFFKEY